MNTPVSFEIAKLLKEKRFDGLTHTNVNYKPEWYHNSYGTLHEYDFFNSFDNMVKAPTIADVVMWLYEKYGVWIEVKKCNYYSFDYKIINGNENLMFKKTPLHRNLKSPTETYEVAIEDAIENLI